MKFQATFSNGQTITRGSHHAYITAAGYVNRETGELHATMFSEKQNPPETRAIYEVTTGRIAKIYGREYVARATQRNAEKAKVWRWEVVKAERIE